MIIRTISTPDESRFGQEKLTLLGIGLSIYPWLTENANGISLAAWVWQGHVGGR